MKTAEHLKSYCRFWKPSVARRITFYFLIFGLVIFFITTMLYMGGTRKHFIRSTSQLINHQFSLMDSAQIPDFIWKGLGKPHPELNQLFQILANISSSFYVVSDIAIYAKETGDTIWYRLFFDADKVLHLNPAQSSFSERLDRNLERHFVKPGLMARSADEHALFVNITKDNDLNTYFLKIGINSENFVGLMKKEAKWIILIFFIALFLSRFLGYYFARKIARPIENLSEISTHVAKGDLTQLAPVKSGDEIGELSANFNKMVEGLREWESVKKIEFELEKGREIQREFLPSQIPELPNWEIATCFYPAGQVSGDFYDVFMLPDGNVGLVIADVCDKGVGSALYMALFRSLIRVFAEQAIHCSEPDLVQIQSTSDSSNTAWPAAHDPMARLEAVSSTNNYIAHMHGRECMFATLFFGVLNPTSGTLSYINGGHEPLYIINDSQVKCRLKPTGPAVGLMPDITFKAQEIQLEPGDLLVGYTDGVTDARSPEGEVYTRDRLQSLLTQPFKSASETIERVKTNLFEFIDKAARSDDVTMLAVQRASVAP
ncbi:MAG: PP2C family protein-serine/threonine phosphatase [Deltaproteobacteria bacterium]|jgi:serine phosphatase RsbU (regulator of sigma subunit)|nr:PP2C family protein-serine/threonine phosphatase [Deltaproteobacteria bacterium]